ncbi:MAG: hypothetical protein IJR99_02810 [Kiritimatiellae bacterium]|nr:hypothetical protein [Kiritimatiellia bacterium]
MIHKRLVVLCLLVPAIVLVHAAVPFTGSTPETCIAAAGSNLVFDAKVDAAAHKNSLRLPDARIPVPGNLTLRVKTFHTITNGWRRFFASEYRQTGYFGYQEMPGSQEMAAPDAALFFAHDFPNAAVNKFLKRTPIGKNTSISFNIEPRKCTYFLNGEKQGEIDLPMELHPEKLGCLVLGGGQGGFEITEWTLYRRPLTDAEVKVLAQGDSPLNGTLAWYPSRNALVADFTYDPNHLTGNALAWRVTPRGDTIPSTSPVAHGELRLTDSFAIKGCGRKLKLIRTVLPLGANLPNGEYAATLSPTGNPSDSLLQKEFTVKKYDWVQNDLGKEDRLLPGFTPVEANGSVLKCVGRTYEIGANGFPVRILADGEQILAAPVALHAECDGREWALPAGNGNVTSRKLSDTVAQYEADADGYSVSGRLEQDGLLRFTLHLSRIPAANRIWLEIPVKKEFAPLFHACGEGVRSNPAGFVPEGTGVVFKSRSIPQTHASNFIPYCWVGTDTRGIAYAADTDLGWLHSEKHDAVEIVRKPDGTVSIVLNLLNEPNAERDAIPCTIELALMASPVKPMPKGWRGWADYFAYRGSRNTRCLISPPYWGNFCAWAGRYPAWGEFEYIRKLRETLDTGKADDAYVKKWIERVCEGTSPETGWTNQKDPAARRTYVTNHAWAGFYIAKHLHGLRDPILYFYTCDSEGATGLAEYAVFRDEWASCKIAIPSYADYAIWHLDQMLACGLQGVYDDNTFICCNYNWATGEAKVDAKGAVHPSFGIWNSREYRRRQANVLVARGLFPWITVHHTNGNILPVLGFAANSMGMEWKYGSSDFQTRFTPDYIRAVCQGLQGGFFPTALDGIEGLGKNPQERIRVTRTMLASLLVHEVRPTSQLGCHAPTVISVLNAILDFGIAEEDCEYTAYWNATNPVTCSEKDVLVSVYRRGDKLLAVCGSWTAEAREVTLSLKSGTIATAKNAENKESIPVTNGAVRFHLTGHDLALIELN